jgi:hypothetical protein
LACDLPAPSVKDRREHVARTCIYSIYIHNTTVYDKYGDVGYLSTPKIYYIILYNVKCSKSFARINVSR